MDDRRTAGEAVTKVYLYILGASSNPDLVECGVPWYLGDGEVFFGPCKKNIRQELRGELLRGADHGFAQESIYLVGFNALGGGDTRKIVWAGRIREAMSFGKAWASLKGDKFKEMRQHEWSPLHVRPVDGSTKPLAYEVVSKEHREKSAWLQDLATNGMVSQLIVTGDVARLPGSVSWWDGFGRDVCFVLEDPSLST